MAQVHEWINMGQNVREVLDLCLVRGSVIEARENNTADIELEGYGRVNNVPIFYHCDGANDTENGWEAFSADDPVVLVRYRHRSNLGEIHYQVVGFQDELRPCRGPGLFLACGNDKTRIRVTYDADSEPFQVGEKVKADGTQVGGSLLDVIPISGSDVWLVADFPTDLTDLNYGMEITGQSSGAIATAGSDFQKWYFRRLYNSLEILNNSPGAITPVGRAADVKNRIISPVEWEPVSEVSFAVTDQWKGLQWSKTYDDVTVMAYAYGPLPVLSRKWAIAATFKGERITINGSGQYGDYPFYAARGLAFEEVLVAFDVWKTGEEYWCAIAEEGRGEGYYSAFKFSESTGNFEREIHQQTNILSEYGENVDGRLKLVGLDGPSHKIYWCRPGSYEPGVYYEESFGESGGVSRKTKEGAEIFDTLWNHVTRKLIFATEDIVTEEELGSSTTWTHRDAFTALGFPQFCIKSYDTETLIQTTWGPLCADLPGVLAGYWTILDRFGTPIPHFITTDFSYDSHYITEWIHFDGGTRFDHGQFKIDGNSYDQGELTQALGASKGGKDSFRVSTGKDYDGWCDQSVKVYEIDKWMFDLEGSAFEISWSQYLSEEDASNNLICLDTPSYFGEETGGNDGVRANGGAWPHNAGWQAILLHGVDANGVDAGPGIVYRDGYTRGLGGITRDFYRCYFTTLQARRS